MRTVLFGIDIIEDYRASRGFKSRFPLQFPLVKYLIFHDPVPDFRERTVCVHQLKPGKPKTVVLPLQRI